MKKHKFLAMLSLLVLALAGCATIDNLEGPPAVMKISSASGEIILMGKYYYHSVAVQADSSTIAVAELSVTDGSVTCTGKTTYSEKGNRVIPVEIYCSNGLEGKVIITFNNNAAWRNQESALGVGSMKDGSKIRLMLGNMAGAMAW